MIFVDYLSVTKKDVAFLLHFKHIKVLMIFNIKLSYEI